MDILKKRSSEHAVAKATTRPWVPFATKIMDTRNGLLQSFVFVGNFEIRIYFHTNHKSIVNPCSSLQHQPWQPWQPWFGAFFLRFRQLGAAPTCPDRRLCDTLLLAVQESISQGEATLCIRVVHLSPFTRSKLKRSWSEARHFSFSRCIWIKPSQHIPAARKMRCDKMRKLFLNSFRPPNGILPSVANCMDIPLIVREHIFDEINLEWKHFSVEA